MLPHHGHGHGKPNTQKRVLRAAPPFDVDVELLGEAVHRQRGELLGRVDVGQVVAGLVESLRLVRIRPPPGRARGTSVAVKLACGTGKPTLT